MDKDNVLRTTSFTISNAQYNWLDEQSKKRLLGKSAVLREAIELLKKEYENGEMSKHKEII